MTAYYLATLACILTYAALVLAALNRRGDPAVSAVRLSWWEWLLLGLLAVFAIAMLAVSIAAFIALFVALIWVIQQVGAAL